MRTVYIITNRDFKSIEAIMEHLHDNGYEALNKKYYDNVLHVCITGITSTDTVLILPDANYTLFGREQIAFALELKKPILSRFIISKKYNPFIQRRNSNSLFGYNELNSYNIPASNDENNTE